MQSELKQSHISNFDVINFIYDNITIRSTNYSTLKHISNINPNTKYCLTPNYGGTPYLLVILDNKLYLINRKTMKYNRIDALNNHPDIEEIHISDKDIFKNNSILNVMKIQGRNTITPIYVIIDIYTYSDKPCDVSYLLKMESIIDNFKFEQIKIITSKGFHISDFKQLLDHINTQQKLLNIIGISLYNRYNIDTSLIYKYDKNNNDFQFRSNLQDNITTIEPTINFTSNTGIKFITKNYKQEILLNLLAIRQKHDVIYLYGNFNNCLKFISLAKITTFEESKMAQSLTEPMIVKCLFHKNNTWTIQREGKSKLHDFTTTHQYLKLETDTSVN